MKEISDRDIGKEMETVPQWERCGQAIKRTFEFRDFMESISFVNRIASAAQEADHHPDMDIRYRKVLCILTTHSQGGLTDKDFSLARRIDGIYSQIY